MKSVLYLVKGEFKLLKKSAILTALILVVFIAAFFGVTSVSSDLMRNLCSYLDGAYQASGITYQSMYIIMDEPATFGGLSAYIGDGNLMYSTDSTYARGDLYAENGNVFEAAHTIESDGYSLLYNFSGYAVYINDASSALFDSYEYDFYGSWLQNEYEICLSAYVANALEVSVGDAVTVAGQQFTLTGIYDTADNSDPAECYDNAYYISVGADTQLEGITIQFSSSEVMFSCYRSLLRTDADVYCNMAYMYDNINEMQAVLAAVAILFAIVIIIAMYSLVSLIFKQRREHICRLKLLGATNKMVAGIYCGIISMIMFAVCLLGTAIGVAFNAYFMYICEYIFGFAFTPQFNFIIPVLTFAALIIICVLLWFTASRKFKQNDIAEAIRHE